LQNKKETLAEMVARYKDKPTETATYEIEGQTFIVTSHFIGDKDLDKVIHDHAFKRALEESETA
jgi:hypothetical protein